MQTDGNLVLYWNGHGALWSSNTANTAGNRAIMQTDGNFVVYATTTPSGRATPKTRRRTIAASRSRTTATSSSIRAPTHRSGRRTHAVIEIPHLSGPASSHRMRESVRARGWWKHRLRDDGDLRYGVCDIDERLDERSDVEQCNDGERHERLDDGHRVDRLGLRADRLRRDDVHEPRDLLLRHGGRVVSKSDLQRRERRAVRMRRPGGLHDGARVLLSDGRAGGALQGVLHGNDALPRFVDVSDGDADVPARSAARRHLALRIGDCAIVSAAR